jgi:hypothetical protein
MSNHCILNPAEHGELRVHTHADAALGDGAMAALVVPGEFRKLQSEYPIVFKRDLESGQFSALALFGFENGENLYLAGGAWDARYRPLSMAIQPFLVGRSASGEGAGHVHVDMDHPRISTTGEGMRVFDETGQPTPYLEKIADMLGMLDEEYRASSDFFAALERHELLEPFTLEVPLSDGSKNTLVGFHTIAEEKLEALDGDALGDLHAGNHLLPIFMAMASLSNFSGLVARKEARLTGG